MYYLRTFLYDITKVKISDVTLITSIYVRRTFSSDAHLRNRPHKSVLLRYIEIVPDGKIINPAWIWQGSLHFDWLLLIPSTISSIPVIMSDIDSTKFIIIPALSAFLYCFAMRDSSRNIENLKIDIITVPYDSLVMNQKLWNIDPISGKYILDPVIDFSFV